MEAAAEAFNKVPRVAKTPTGLPNHWFFSVRHVPLNPPGDLVHLVHPPSRLVHVEGPRQIGSLPSPDVKADAVVPLLLKAFITGTSTGPDGKPLAGVKPTVPWTWGTNDVVLAKAVEDKLKSIGVREELCVVQTGNKEHEKISDECWSGFLSELTKQAGLPNPEAGKVCGRCKTGGSLKQCAKCKKEVYCSRECQTADWKQHKKICASLAGGAVSSVSSSNLDAFAYYNNHAHKVPEAQELAKSLNLTLPTGGNEGLIKPVRRLIITGKDTIGNFQLLMGPQWRKIAGSMREEQRLDVLLRPQPGSPSYALHHQYDEDTPTWSPTPATTAENEKVQEIREMQDFIVSRVGPGKQPDKDEMRGILTAFGANWAEKLGVYQTALNALDQGVHA
ncbi:hypothetical protein ASPWEDRAFT_176660 [Aspergillus wentii DTO 134E9]|uniref:MYND-type domain-containing protein n=1 Tax=Aspergillus wentii DTO 134E9 TaxID=1073089 RepID=A0A1L9R9J1_ASPWE|nr:uncharacterized protein ASPWEDRAFT_176660 [Aspergillus wentii DTO 134E9]KAI9926370.1 hypothetical protein MW887_004134 [Aspergillus wentii]OJJ31595.1 hypothetical protein ASPWEDRAFT_176660 [Aspergillus wentii DTO 134E9]